MFYINDNPMTTGAHLKCDLLHSKTCILLSNKNSKDPVGMDHKNILISLAVKKFMRENMSAKMKIMNPEFSLCI
jgi:hypothetical protein